MYVYIIFNFEINFQYFDAELSSQEYVWTSFVTE